MFHGIDDKNSTLFNTRFISKKKFESLLVLLKKNGNVISVDAYCERNTDPDRMNFTITFDDGYLNNLTHALPLLEKHQVPASVFVTCIYQENKDILWADLYDLCCDHLPSSIDVGGILFRRNSRGEHASAKGITLKCHASRSNRDFLLDLYHKLEPFAKFRSNSRFDNLWKLLMPTDIAAIANHPLITIGSHSMLHLDYSFQNNQDALLDMQESKAVLENLTGKKIYYLAFPTGPSGVEKTVLAREAGYKFLFNDKESGKDSIDKQNTFTRIGINPYVSALDLLLYIKKGHY